MEHLNTVSSNKQPRLVFIANSMCSNLLSGGDIHTINMCAYALRVGYPVHFLTGHPLKSELARRELPVNVTLTDLAELSSFKSSGGQLRMLITYLGRVRRTVARLAEIGPHDIAYANTEFWWDSLPMFLSKAEHKLMILGMDCPTLKQILIKSRPDVPTLRVASLHYWFSQQLALRWFRFCARKRLLYIHPNQKGRLLRLGYRDQELKYVSNGFDQEYAEAVPQQNKIYDAAWTGRVHQQKGIEDLLRTFVFLAQQFSDFRAVIIGNVEKSLGPHIRALGLSQNVDFPGFVSEAEKFRLLKSSRVFLMPSRYESWGIVIAEALASGVPVVAYELDAYRAIFGNLLIYVPAFDVQKFEKTVAEAILKIRSGKELLDPNDLAKFRRENSWEAAGARFVDAVNSF